MVLLQLHSNTLDGVCVLPFKRALGNHGAPVLVRRLCSAPDRARERLCGNMMYSSTKVCKLGHVMYEAIKHHTIGFQTILKAGIKWVHIWQLRAYIMSMHSYTNASIKGAGQA